MQEPIRKGRRGGLPVSSQAIRLVAAALAGSALGTGLLARFPEMVPELSGTIPPGWQATAAAALATFLIARLFRLPPVLGGMAALLPPFAALLITVSVPAYVYPVILVLLLGVFWNVRSDRVPLYLSNRKTAAAVAALIPADAGAERVIDLGSGLGDMVIGLARLRPGLSVTGVESAPLPYLASRLRLGVSGVRNARLVWGDIWRQDLSKADIVYAFLSDAPMDRLLAKARAEMRPGSMLISNSFRPESDPPDRSVDVGDNRKTKLFIWKF